MEKEIIYTKEFWQKVKNEYDSGKMYICMSSQTFMDAYYFSHIRGIIENLASSFMKDNSHYFDKFKVGYACLFCSAYASTFEIIRIRHDFIDWCINKFN